MTNDKRALIKRQTHIIDRQIFDLQFASSAVAKQAQHDVQEMNIGQLLPMINGLLDEWFSPDEVITIQKLELDLGTISIRGGLDEWMQRIKEQLEEKLLPFANNKRQMESKFYAQKQHIKEHLLHAFIYFLQNGSLDQPFVFASLDEIKAGLLLMDKRQQEHLQQALIALPEELLLQRLVSNFSWEELAFFLQVFQPGITLKQGINLLSTARQQLSKYEALNKIAAASIDHRIKAERLFLRQFFATIIGVTKAIVSIRIAKAEEWKEALVRDMNTGAAGKGSLIAASVHEIETFESETANSIDNFKGQWINNAGLCLLYPWLDKFFEAVGICHAGAFVNREMQEHSIYLLHFIATNEEDATEEKLLFPKLLCGWPWQMPSINSIAISDREKKEVEDLLQSVIDHWKALRSTSPDGLREAFLQRAGNLVKQEDHFLLQPEQQGIDVLLDQIPWGFRNILLPWMKKPIVVEWY
jgi:hypothetical protein